MYIRQQYTNQINHPNDVHSIEYDHPCTVNVSLHATIEENTENITEFSLDLVSPVEYLFRKFSANEFGKPCVTVTYWG